MLDVDMLLTGEIYRGLLKDIARGKYLNLECFIEELCEFKDEDLSDAFVHKMQTICRLLIDNKAYDYVVDILDLRPILGTYENKANEGEECVISYAIRKIEDENILARFLETCQCGELTYCFFDYDNPALIAASLKKYETLRLVFDKELCVEERGFGEFTALQYAVLNGDYDLAKFLLEELHFNPDLCDIVEMPPIAIAADKNDFKMAEYLIACGADVSALDEEGRSAIFYCRSDKMLEIFKGKGACRDNLQIGLVSRAAMDFKQKGYISSDLIDMLLDYDVPIIQNKKYNLAVLAAKYGDVDALKRFSSLLGHVNTLDIIFAAFDSYKLSDMIMWKDVGRMIEITDILIDSGVHQNSPTSPMLSPFRSLALKPQLLLGEEREKVIKLFDNVSKLGYSLEDTDILGCNIFHEALEGI
ncbi:MAG: ankyrin repeat domain-containing protein, partial [Clostridia bacterium]|nr:ankyrin repeat domain-containing protein [Clostridia bacterium]